MIREEAKEKGTAAFALAMPFDEVSPARYAVEAVALSSAALAAAAMSSTVRCSCRAQLCIAVAAALPRAHSRRPPHAAPWWTLAPAARGALRQPALPLLHPRRRGHPPLRGRRAARLPAARRARRG
eukprot:5064504-Prymnesium_polylepis.1